MDNCANITPIGSSRAEECEDVRQGRTTDPRHYGTQLMQSYATDKVLQAVPSSGSTGRSFPFLVSVRKIDGKDVMIRAKACDDKYVYESYMKRDAGVNPLLVVNATAEGMRRAAG